jgi:hypothetical protein
MFSDDFPFDVRVVDASVGSAPPVRPSALLKACKSIGGTLPSFDCHNQFVQLEANRTCVSVLGVLNQESNQKCNDAGPVLTINCHVSEDFMRGPALPTAESAHKPQEMPVVIQPHRSGQGIASNRSLIVIGNS